MVFQQKPLLASAKSFRRPMPVTQVFLFRDGNTFPVCPRCQITLEREYQKFCDRCGQALGWEEYAQARIVRDPSHSPLPMRYALWYGRG